jgi:hypothetical protein
MLNAQSLDAPQMHKLKIQYSFCCAVVRALLLNNHLIHAAFWRLLAGHEHQIIKSSLQYLVTASL